MPTTLLLAHPDLKTQRQLCTAQDKSKVENPQNFVAFSEYMSFNNESKWLFAKQN